MVTSIKILSGVYEADRDSILRRGLGVHLTSPRAPGRALGTRRACETRLQMGTRECPGCASS